MTLKRSQSSIITLQDMILNLQHYWSEQGCVILQPVDTEVGAGTFHWATTLRALGSQPWKAAYVQPSRRPTDGRYGENPFRLQHYYQFQTILKPSPSNSQKLFLNSLNQIEIDPATHDIRFIEDDWKSPTLGAAGVGWEVTCDGMEVAQFTYFQRICGMDCAVVSTEITYGLERLAMFVQGKDSVFDIQYNNQHTYGDLFLRAEKEESDYNFSHANVEELRDKFNKAETMCKQLCADGLCFPAYNQCLKSSHLLNLLDARGAVVVTERESLIGRVREMAVNCGALYLRSEQETVQQQAESD